MSSIATQSPSALRRGRAGPGPTLPQALLDEFVARSQHRVFPRNTVVVLEGEPAEALYVILEGQVRVFVADEDGREVELNLMGPGEYFGELMLAEQRRTASVRTVTQARLCVVQRGDFEAVLAARPDIAFHVIHTLIHRVRVLTGNVASLALMDVYGRVARLLQENARAVDGRLTLPGMSQQTIAERIGASRSMVNRILKDLVAGGYLKVAKDEIEILRPLPRRW
jgi:CRP/FNR family cyclic AMP-dependent transcriptional regulator